MIKQCGINMIMTMELLFRTLQNYPTESLKAIELRIIEGSLIVHFYKENSFIADQYTKSAFQKS